MALIRMLVGRLTAIDPYERFGAPMVEEQALDYIFDAVKHGYPIYEPGPYDVSRSGGPDDMEVDEWAKEQGIEYSEVFLFAHGAAGSLATFSNYRFGDARGRDLFLQTFSDRYAFGSPLLVMGSDYDPTLGTKAERER